mmetsp:Transcript_583/g.839  ORF Transcript_583/g.839 Transcript_583/m.839 type:complete len:847 (+) Transcript_583:151-2691(+)
MTTPREQGSAPSMEEKANKSEKSMVAARSLLMAVAGADVLLGLVVVLRHLFTDRPGAEEDPRFGGSINDLGYISVARGCFDVFVALFLYACRPGKKFRVELLVAVATVALSFAYFSFVMSKLISRLVDDGPWETNLAWFWTTTLSASTLCVLDAWFLLRFLRCALVFRIDWLETRSVAPLEENLLSNASEGNMDESILLSPRRLARKKVDDRRLFGTTFDVLYGKIEGIDAEDDLEEEEKLEKKSERAKKLGLTGDAENKLDVPKIDKKSSMQMLGSLSKMDWPILLAASVSLVLASIFQAAIPYLTGKIITTVASATEQSELEGAILKLLGAALVSAIFTALRGSLFTVAGAAFNVRIRITLLESLLGQEVAFYDQIKSGALSSRINSDTTTVSDQVSLNANVFLRSLVQAVVVLIFMFKTNVELSFATFATVPVVSLVTVFYGEMVWYSNEQAQKRLANANAVSDAALTTMHNVRAFASEVSEHNRYVRKLGYYYILQARTAAMYAVYCVINTLLPNLATGLVLFYGAKLAADGLLKPGDLVSFMLYQQSLSAAINSIGDVFSGIAAAFGAADKVFELIARTPKETTKGNKKPEEFDGTIEFRDVSFRYPARPDSIVLNGVSFKMPTGKIWALVGASGGGKSSILRLLQRLYDPSGGEILIGGHNIAELDHEYLHEKLCIVGQEPVLYARSISENIGYGLKEMPPMEKIIEAAKAANAHDFIMTFQDGYDTSCGDRGVTLSGGQKQRIAIARALIRSGKILLLDEATSALDAESEAQVQSTLDNIMSSGKHTCLVVAHRLSTVRDADQIVCMKEGKIVEIGTHDELVADKSSFYYSLIEKQMTK